MMGHDRFHRFRKTWSFRTKLVVLNSILLGVLCLVVFIYFPAKLEESEIEGLSRKVNSVTEMASFGISPALHFGDRDAAFEILIGAAEIEDLAYAVLLDNDNHTFVDYRPGTRYSHIAPALVPGQVFVADGKILQASAAVTQNGRHIGRIYVGVILERIRAEIFHMRLVIALLILTFFIVGTLAVVGISTLVTRPLTHMAHTVQRIAGGDLTTRALVLSGDEVGQFAHSFNQMVDQVESAYQKLQESERRFRSLIENGSDMIAVVSEGGTLRYQSPSAERILGYPNEYLLGHDAWALIHPDDREIVQQVFREALHMRRSVGPVEYRVRHSDGTWQTLETQGTNLIDDPVVEGVVLNSRDVTERKRVEEKLKSSLRDKESLLQEIHHRVKNNLQIISSLLNLQARRTTDPAVLEVLSESRNRIGSMALIHEKLYESSNLASIDFEEYITMLTGMLMRSYGTSLHTVKPTIRARGVTLGIDTAIPCGLILNELVSNSLKYAFPGEGEGEIRIELYPTDQGRYVLEVADNGIGLPETINFRNTRSLGMRLVCSLTEQLQGTVELRRNGGTEFHIEFSEIRYVDRG